MPEKVCVYVFGNVCLIIGAFMEGLKDLCKMNMKTNSLSCRLIKNFHI